MAIKTHLYIEHPIIGQATFLGSKKPIGHDLLLASLQSQKDALTKHVSPDLIESLSFTSIVLDSKTRATRNTLSIKFKDFYVSLLRIEPTRSEMCGVEREVAIDRYNNSLDISDYSANGKFRLHLGFTASGKERIVENKDYIKFYEAEMKSLMEIAIGLLGSDNLIAMSRKSIVSLMGKSRVSKDYLITSTSNYIKKIDKYVGLNSDELSDVEKLLIEKLKRHHQNKLTVYKEMKQTPTYLYRYIKGDCVMFVGICEDLFENHKRLLESGLHDFGACDYLEVARLENQSDALIYEIYYKNQMNIDGSFPVWNEGMSGEVSVNLPKLNFIKLKVEDLG